MDLVDWVLGEILANYSRKGTSPTRFITDMIEGLEGRERKHVNERINIQFHK